MSTQNFMEIVLKFDMIYFQDTCYNYASNKENQVLEVGFF